MFELKLIHISKSDPEEAWNAFSQPNSSVFQSRWTHQREFML